MQSSTRFGRGRLLALCCQLILLATSTGIFALAFVCLIPGQDAGGSMWTAVHWGLPALPNLVLVYALFRRIRGAAWFGLCAAVVELYMHLPVVFLLGSWPGIARVLLWGLTAVGLSIDIMTRRDAPISRAPGFFGSRALRAALFAFLGLFAAALPFLIVFASLFASSLPRGGTAPQTDHASRRAWGERVYGPYLNHIDTWAADAELILSDVGNVKSIAPIDGPNRYHSGFTDGGYAQMNLEIIGEQGQGELMLPYVEIWSDGRLQSIGDEARWKFNGTEHIIAKSGKSYLAGHDLEQIHAKLLDLANRGIAEDFVALWPEFEFALEVAVPIDSVHRCLIFQGVKLIEQLPDLYRQPLLVHFAEAQARLNRPNIAADVYCQAAETTLALAEDVLEQDTQHRELARARAALHEANSLLKQSHTLDPEHQTTLTLARQRVVLQHLLAVGAPPQPGYDETQKQRDRWAKDCLDMLYDEAVAYALRSAYLERSVGIENVHLAPGSHSELIVNQKNLYSTTVYLELSGKKCNGELQVRIREDHKRCTSLDLFAESPRGPDYPLTIISPYWTAEGESRIKLSAKTGEPKSNKRKTQKPQSP